MIERDAQGRFKKSRRQQVLLTMSVIRTLSAILSAIATVIVLWKVFHP